LKKILPKNFLYLIGRLADSRNLQQNIINKNLHMKNSGLTALITGLLFTALFISCDPVQNKDVNLSENEDLRYDVYQQILNDEQLFSEFMTEMSQNENAMETMMAEQPMREMFYGRQQILDMMGSNPEIRENILQGVMDMMRKDSAVYNRMQYMMEQHRTAGPRDGLNKIYNTQEI
jgi:hypothetical protein